jgi:hypothetical protein
MTTPDQRFEKHELIRIYERFGGDMQLEDCAHETVWRETFVSKHPKHLGTIEQKKVRHTKPGFQMDEIIYTKEDGTEIHSIKYLWADGAEYRLRNDHPNPC